MLLLGCPHSTSFAFIRLHSPSFFCGLRFRILLGPDAQADDDYADFIKHNHRDCHHYLGEGVGGGREDGSRNEEDEDGILSWFGQLGRGYHPHLGQEEQEDRDAGQGPPRLAETVDEREGHLLEFQGLELGEKALAQRLSGAIGKGIKNFKKSVTDAESEANKSGDAKKLEDK